MAGSIFSANARRWSATPRPSAASASSGSAEAATAEAGAFAGVPVRTEDRVSALDVDDDCPPVRERQGSAPAGLAGETAESGCGDAHARGSLFLGKSFGIGEPDRLQHVKAEMDGGAVAGDLRHEPEVCRQEADGAGLAGSQGILLYGICFIIEGNAEAVNVPS